MQRSKYVHFAKLAEDAERYEEMSMYMSAVCQADALLSVEERNLLSAAFKNVVGRCRASWRIITSVEEKHRSEGNHAHASWTNEYRMKIEKELRTTCVDILKLLDEKLIPTAEGCESRLFYQKMKGDYWRYVAEITTGEEHSTAAEQARQGYQNAQYELETHFASTHPIRLGLALSHAVFQYEVLQNCEVACAIARAAFEAAIAEIDDLREEDYKDATLIMQLLRDNLAKWTSDENAPQ
eukprot:TRINITY_DN70778_c0_g1_i1.p1 TRINITY_DN70778_c0_g1~~TRINITY_DN70778_c0_g1_i1.p1  ORF type:complete len:239 (-),score=53.15 TRINITY_DN70778_c0_g1_i1:81-797(-)